MSAIQCTNCHKPYPESGVPYRCKNCGGIFDLSVWPPFDVQRIDSSQPGIWRYIHSFGLPAEASSYSLGEGNTPLVWGDVASQKVAFKCEYLNPTGSFKDRGSTIITSYLRFQNVDEVVEDSSGNAGASLAAYCAKAGIKTQIFTPQHTSGPKRRQIEAYGAQVIEVEGSRSDAAMAVRDAADAGKVYASHAYLPFNLVGYATAAYEIVDQLGEAPGSVFLPVGQGGLFLGMARGFEALMLAGVIEFVPTMVAVQARACAPLWALFTYGPAGLGLVSEGQTAAAGIRVLHPLRGDRILAWIETHDGILAAVDEYKVPVRGA